MRAPVQTFKSELAAFRARPTSPCGKAVEGVLDRWRDDDRVEKVWQKIQRHAPNLAAAVLIKQVLDARWSAVGSVNRQIGAPGARGFNAEWSEFLPTLKKRLNRKLSSSPPPLAVDVAVALELAAAEVRMIHDCYFGHSDQVPFPLKREGSNEDRSRAAFYKLMTDFFQKHCSLKLPEEVAVLAEVAIPGKEVHADNVTNVLKPRRPKQSPSE
jgi:hypothetical protein